MKISEMSLEQLQDYALQLENDKQGLADELATERTKTADLQELNTALQKRNNQLFMQVEQQPIGKEQDAQGEKEQPTVSCEEFATNNFKELIR